MTPRSDGYIPPCIPTRATKVPAGPDWVHEIKHDGYRLIVRRDGDAVRLFTRRGYDWSGRYPAIAVTAMQLRARWFTLVDGRSRRLAPGLFLLAPHRNRRHRKSLQCCRR